MTRTLRISFQVLIMILFVGVVLSLGLGLVFLSFDRAKAISRSAAVAYIDRVAEQTSDRVDAQFQGAIGALELLRQFPSVKAEMLSDNTALYTVLAAVLRTHPSLYSLYVGYDDGRFIEMEMIERGGHDQRARLGGPQDAELLLTIVDGATADTRAKSMLFLNSDLQVVKANRGPVDYDPRTRPWYKDALAAPAAAVTDPYVFADEISIGYTVHARVDAPAGVAGGDILLAQTDAFLKAQQIGVAGTVFLFDDDGRVVAHPKMQEYLRLPTPGAALKVPNLQDVESADVFRAITAWQNGGAAQQFFDDAAGRTYVAAFRPILTSGSAGLMLAVIAPLDAFFGKIETERRDLVVLTLALVAGTLPFVLWIGWLLGRSVRSLAVETDRIRRFDFATPPRLVRSLVREIDDLGRSVATMGMVVQDFTRFVPKRLVQQLVTSGAALSLGGSRRQITILFSDIANFTHITENAEPEQVMLFTSRYLATLSEVIMRHGGTVDKFVGDSVMAIWNAPADDPDHVAHACAAVLACRDANRALNDAFARDGWPAFRTRFGVHTGEAVVGNVGSADRMSYTVLGAAVNLASRLESLNRRYGTEILVSEAVRNAAMDHFSFRFVDTVQPKGFEARTQVYELLGQTVVMGMSEEPVRQPPA
jgi:adenylate cyclase